MDSIRIRAADLSRTIQGPLPAKVRGNLRRQHGSSKDLRSRLGTDAVLLDEPLCYPELEQQVYAAELPVESSHTGIDDLAAVGHIVVVNALLVPQPTQELQGLTYAGFSPSVCVMAAFGMVVASMALRVIAGV